jgi:hypothetical protein
MGADPHWLATHTSGQLTQKLGPQAKPHTNSRCHTARFQEVASAGEQLTLRSVVPLKPQMMRLFSLSTHTAYAGRVVVVWGSNISTSASFTPAAAQSSDLTGQ